MLTPRGLLAGSEPPIIAAQRDARTAAGLRETRCLIGSFDIREVALFRTLGLPATWVGGLLRPDLGLLKITNSMYVEDASWAEPQRPATSATAAGESSHPHHLYLMGWSPLRLCLEPPPLLAKLASYLAANRQQLGHNFSNIWVWRPSQDQLDKLHFRLHCRDVELARELLLASFDSVRDFEAFRRSCAASTPRPHFRAGAGRACRFAGGQ